jgi:predicted esterase
MASPSRPDPLVIQPKGRHTATLIFSHGLGDQGAGWADAAQLWHQTGRLDQLKVVLPNAPRIPITCNGGMRMPGWFDIVSLNGTPESLREDEDRPGSLATRDYLASLVQAEIDAGISSDRIVLGGFSQGGAVSILTAVTSPYKLGGMVGLSTWMILSEALTTEAGLRPETNPNQDLPVLMCHGDADPLVPYEMGRMTAKLLTDFGCKLTFKTYP